ncbi:MAG TPA: arylamine N-acetyltransferase [Burkholderiales bacterium]|nr:arylamine N-acetyltransferase [Burkholderiales bacterium]
MSSRFLDLYFERIRFEGSPRADLETLRELHLLHLQHIPYENVDVFCQQGVKLDPEALTQKMLLRRRGGYCFEQNGLFLMALTEIGFKCRPNLARVHRNRPQPGGRTHHINLVALDGRTWVCDVGFGGSAFRHPVPLEAGVEIEQMGERFRLHEDREHGFYLLKQIGSEWQPQYTFKIDTALPIDMAMANFYTSKSADHVFLNAIVGTRMTERGRVTLSDHTFKVFDLTRGRMKRETVTDFDAYVGKLEEHLGVYLNDTETRLFRQRFATLKPPEIQPAIEETNL